MSSRGRETMKAKTKAKFHVGQIVAILDYTQAGRTPVGYDQVDALPEMIGDEYHYVLLEESAALPESCLRDLAPREVGPRYQRRKGVGRDE